ncbi:MAG: 30S ribosomal protein S6 [Lachnospiraceae bacterium]|nr:30S ribosomal protein S6 [Lachnospiraceae bacterium]
MQKYELVVVLNGSLEDDERSAAMERVSGYITRFGGNITNVDDWGKKKLAYEIQKMSEAYYTVVTFEAPLEAPAQIEENIRIMEQVVRFLIVKQEA